MTEHKSLPVAGYRPQSDLNIQIVNLNKQLEERILRALDDLADADEEPDAVDQRWLAIGRQHIEIAFMAINRAIFQPSRVDLAD